MNKTTAVFIILFATLISMCIPAAALYAGQASATASVLIIIPPREAATETKLVQEEKTQQQDEGETEVVYAKN